MSNGGDYQGHWASTPGIPYSNVEFDDIKSGVRSTLTACQYFIKGLPGICQYWLDGDPGSCEYIEKDSKGRSIYPSGWNRGHCDFLGRRSLCNKYTCRNILDDLGNETSEPDEDLEQYMCVAPDPFRTGLIKDELDDQIPPKPTGKKIAVPKEDINGYNEDVTTGIGRCDGCGQGKGDIGFALSAEGKNYSLDSYKKLPVICPYYRPWHMGFGAITPKTTDITSQKVTWDDKGRPLTDEREELEQRLPFSFRIYNLRARCQKCAHWDKDYGSEFVLETAGLSLESDDEDRSDFCVCTESLSTDYHTVNDEAFVNYEGYMLLENVWSKAGSVVCNGAKPECPCYTGNWIYCIDEKVADGDKISAQQIMELRFWMSDWSNQEVYDRFFERKPNQDDPKTADIYTFTKWQRLSSEVSDSIMEGTQVHMCQPAVFWKKEFDPELYMTITPITYPKAHIEDGTTTPTQVSFSSLVRDLEYVVTQPLEIIYPYATEDPFNPLTNPVCGEGKNQFVKRTNSMDGASIRVVGYTLRGKNVYVFNSTYTGIDVPELREYNSGFSIPADQRENFYKKLKKFIKNICETKGEYICQGTSVDGTSADAGTFNVGPLPLKYQMVNELIICVDLGGVWEFRKRHVWPQWYGGAVVQTGFTGAAGTGGVGSQPIAFRPSASVAGDLIPFYSSNPCECRTKPSDVYSVHSYRSVDEEGNIEDQYSYCIIRVTEEDKEIRQWVRIGQSSLLWVELPDINLNYIFEWEITEAKMTFQGEDNECCGAETQVEMEVRYPNSWYVDQKNIAPNTCVLEPKDGKPRNFFSSKWVLTVNYRYLKLFTVEGISFPTDEGDLMFPTTHYSEPVPSPFTINQSDPSSFTIDGVSRGTVAVMGYFTDENDRLMSTMATKMLTHVVRLECRGVEIYYKYEAPGKVYLLQPSSGFRTWIGPDSATGETHVHNSRPLCGDHKCGDPCIGPMWFPFNTCDFTQYYTVYAGGSSCTMPHEGTPRLDYRYCGPDKYKAWVQPGGNWLSTCGVLWAYYYSKAIGAGDVVFTGYVKKVGAIDVPFYLAEGWALPPFGVGGREIIRKFLSQDYQCHISYTTHPFSTKAQWMPTVPDLPANFMTFNAFEQAEGGGTYVAPNYFSHTHQLNFLCLDGEDVESTRQRFEDVYEVQHHALCSYPPPIFEVGTVCHYNFKYEDTAWAWQEWWRPIERYLGEGGLHFISQIIRPEYLAGYYKDEHRYICDEGEHTFVYTAPVIEEGVYSKHPSISLDGDFPRYFNVLYGEDEYNEECVKWEDENVGLVDGSGGEDEPSIYEETSGNNWNHWKDSDGGGILFEAGAVKETAAAENAGRAIITGRESDEDITKYYNRGIVINIPRDRLRYLPYEEVVLGVGPVIEPESISWIWYNETPVFTFSFEEEELVCVSKIRITGKMGSTVIGDESVEFCKPNITVRSSAGWVFESLVGESGVESVTSDEESVAEFTVEMEFQPTPIRMLEERDSEIKITMIPLSDKCIQITSVQLFGATYIGKTETIKTWERLYVTSTLGSQGGENINPNGPQKILTYAEDLDNSGQYLPVRGHSDPYKAVDKMRAGAAHEGYGIGEDRFIIVSKETLKEVEREEQAKLYQRAYDLDPVEDELEYCNHCPVKFSQFFEEYGIPFYMGGRATFTTTKVPWADHSVVQQFKQYDFWRPGGHKFQWSGGYFEDRCYVLSFGMEKIYETLFLHVDHAEAQPVWDPGNALYTGRFEHITAVYDRTMMLFGVVPDDKVVGHPIAGDWKFHT